MFPDEAIVFCGYTGNPDSVIADRKKVTGILEKWNPGGTLDVIAVMQPDIITLVAIYDQTESGICTRDDSADVIIVYKKKDEV